jgi:hypothetical protein
VTFYDAADEISEHGLFLWPWRQADWCCGRTISDTQLTGKRLAAEDRR